ncbi:hypothetical protein [Mucilaginibacter sp. R-33]|uniref:hypothetical protein n=1 Tax=Mucilaginibacter sp. R-33 TaxID=3416711 RepID=UPI003CF2103A
MVQQIKSLSLQPSSTDTLKQQLHILQHTVDSLNKISLTNSIHAAYYHDFMSGQSVLYGTILACIIALLVGFNWYNFKRMKKDIRDKFDEKLVKQKTQLIEEIDKVKASDISNIEPIKSSIDHFENELNDLSIYVIGSEYAKQDQPLAKKLLHGLRLSVAYKKAGDYKAETNILYDLSTISQYTDVDKATIRANKGKIKAYFANLKQYPETAEPLIHLDKIEETVDKIIEG